MTTKTFPRFVLVEECPIFDHAERHVCSIVTPLTDYSYQTEALARKMARRLTDDRFLDSESHVFVARADDIYHRPVLGPTEDLYADLEDELPF